MKISTRGLVTTVAAVLTAGILGVAPAQAAQVSAATPAARATTTLTGWTKSITDSGYVLRARLSQPGQTVNLQRRSGAILRTGKTSSTGWVTFKYAASAGYFRIVFRGTSTLAPAQTSWTTLPKAGATLSASKARYGAHSWKITSTLRGSLHSGKRIYLQRWTGRSWIRTGHSCVTGAHGHCSVTAAQSSSANNGRWYRLRYVGSSMKKAASSGRFHITKRGTTTSSRCEPGYSPCLPVVSDLDCNQISAADKPVRVTGSDPYRLDADHDGWGCES